MSDSSHELKLPSNLGRRRFNQLLTLAAGSVLLSTVSFPANAYADTSLCSDFDIKQEKYHIFIGEQLARSGGWQAVTLKSGVIKEVPISKYTTYCTHITLEKAALDGGDAVVVLHTLYDPFKFIDQAIVSVPLLGATYDRCQDVYQQVKRGRWVSDPEALDILDTIVSGSSKIKKALDGKLLQKRYLLASQNCRLAALQAYIEDAIDNSEISSERKQKLRGVYQYVRANEALPSTEDLDALTSIDAIVQGSTLPIPIRQRYAVASAQTRAFTVDSSIQSLIRTNYPVEEEAWPYLETYHQVRLGRKIRNQIILAGLDTLITESNLPPEAKAVYKLARDRFFQQDEQQVARDLEEYLQTGKQAAGIAARIVPSMTQIFAAGGVTAGTGTAISSLTGAAATNATLAALGGGSVAAGGLGMLGGLAIATGGAALVGAAALVSVSIVAGMSPSELRKLGVAATAGTLASAGVMGTAWAIATTFIITESLTGAAAITAAIATLGGLGVMTGGAALIAFGVGLGVWQFLKNDDAVLADMLRQIEPTLYVITNPEDLDLPLFSRIEAYLSRYKGTDRTYLAPNISIDKVSNVLSNYTFIDRDERVLALRDTSTWWAWQDGIAFTDRGIWWKYSSLSKFVEYADAEYFLKIKDLPVSEDDKESQKIYELALLLGKDSLESRMSTV